MNAPIPVTLQGAAVMEAVLAWGLPVMVALLGIALGWKLRGWLKR